MAEHALFPTKTRLALLRDVADSATRVYDEHSWSGKPVVAWLEWRTEARNVRRSRVTARVRELRNAGWIRTRPGDVGLHQQDYELTDEGRKVLDEAGGHDG